MLDLSGTDVCFQQGEALAEQQRHLLLAWDDMYLWRHLLPQTRLEALHRSAGTRLLQESPLLLHGTADTGEHHLMIAMKQECLIR